MREVGFVKTSMPEETRIALLPEDKSDNIEDSERLSSETGYGKQLGIEDSKYAGVGGRR